VEEQRDSDIWIMEGMRQGFSREGGTNGRMGRRTEGWRDSDRERERERERMLTKQKGREGKSRTLSRPSTEP
jgi:hypothetical protein